MVRRLVEEQDVGILEKEPGQRDAHHPATAELVDRALHVVLREAEPRQDPSRLGVEGVATHRLEPMLETSVLVHELGQLVLVGGIGQLRLDVAHATPDAGQLARAGQHLAEHTAAA